MDQVVPHECFRAFCHVKAERSFIYDGEVQAFICHRCTGIYTTFLIAFLVALYFKWDGYWFKGQSKITAFISAFGLLLLSAIHVKFVQNNGFELLDGGMQRYIVGSLSGLGLLQLACLMMGRVKSDLKPLSQPYLTFVVLYIGHSYLVINYWFYHSVISIVSLVVLYVFMNQLVLGDFLKSKPYLKYPIIILIVAAEWVALYFINTRNG